jgi:hypothetical protein
MPARSTSGAALSVLALWSLAAACTLTVDTEELQRGDQGLSCDETQKVCPDRTSAGRGICVSKTNASYGCRDDSCSSCTLPNASARCSKERECAIAGCTGPHYDCNDSADDGCEVDWRRDERNCGSCGNECRADNGATACSDGQCLIVYCSDPFRNCDGKYATGCETDVSTSEQHCGECGSKCAGTCEDGVCNP